jgi:CheY-like chemotaxis protein
MRKILICESDVGFREVLVAGLLWRLRDVEFRIAKDGIQAIEQIEGVDLAILSLELNGPNAFSVVHEMQSYPDLAQVPIILLTNGEEIGKLEGYGNITEVDKGYLNPDELVLVVEKLLKKMKKVKF